MEILLGSRECRGRRTFPKGTKDSEARTGQRVHDYHLEKNEPSGSGLEFLRVRAKVRVMYRCDVRASIQCLVRRYSAKSSDSPGKRRWKSSVTTRSASNINFGNIVPGVFTPVLAKHSKSFSLIDCISVGVDRMQRNFEPMRKQVETWQRSELTDVTAKVSSMRRSWRANSTPRNTSPASSMTSTS